MCVIIVKPQGVKMPNKDILDACREANTDGVGYCTSSGKFNKSTNYELIKNDLLNIQQNDKAIIHFRFATQGSVIDANCHPFISNDIYFAHNGCLPFLNKTDQTDSEIFFRNKVMPVVKKYGLNSNKSINLLNKYSKLSKFALMYNSELFLFGTYFAVNGCLFSNLRWQCKQIVHDEYFDNQLRLYEKLFSSDKKEVF